MSSDVPNDDVVIRVDHVSKCFEMYEKPRHRLQQMLFGKMFHKKWYKEFWALKDVSFDIHRGECVGIIGRNGSGKSTILQIITGTLPATEGCVTIKPGLRIAALLELGSGFNPEFTGRDNVYMNASILGLSTEEAKRCFPEIEAFADIGEFIDQPVKTYSSGMMVRLAFAVQVMVKPDILIVDEALAVGDAAFQKKCLGAMSKLFREKNCTVLFVSHSQDVVKTICNRSILLERGVMLFNGDVESAFQKYTNPKIIAYSPKTVDLKETIRESDDLPLGCRINTFSIEGHDECTLKVGEKLCFSVEIEGTDDLDGMNFRVVVIPAGASDSRVTMASTEPKLSIRKGERKK